MKKKAVFILPTVILSLILACNLPSLFESDTDQEAAEEAVGLEEISPDQEGGQVQMEGSESSTEVEQLESGRAAPPPVSGAVIPPENLVYLGAFRLPDDPNDSWGYSGTALTYYPGGDPNGPEDGYPGSLFGVGNDQRVDVSEISIPIPVNSRNLEDLNTATTLQPFQDLSSGLFDPEAVSLPVVGLEYLSPQGDQTSGKLHFCFGQWIQGFEASHGWRELNLSDPQAAGLWHFGDYSNYTTNDYIFEIPKSWADVYTPGQYLAAGRAREGPWSGNGPALYAYGPWEDGNPPEPGAHLGSITPLLLYGIHEPGIAEIVTDETMAVNERSNADRWFGGAWLTAGDTSAVIFVGTKAVGNAWYGFANGVEFVWGCEETNSCPEVPEWPYDDRGFWADDYQAQIMFYDPAQLAAVVGGEMESWEPQPYAMLDITEYMFAPNIDPAIYKRDIAGTVAFDRERGLLYIAERIADEYKSVIHVWQVEPGQANSSETEPLIQASNPGGSLDKWSLWSSGTQLRGANVHQWQVHPELVGTEVIGPGPVGPPLSQGDFDRMAAMGANYANLSVPGIFTVNPPYELHQGILDNLDQVVNMAGNAGMYVVISYRTGPGRSEFTFMWDEVGDWFDESYLNDAVWGEAAAQDAWVEMWRQTAEHFQGNPVLVGYDLMVEPNANDLGSDALHGRLEIWDPQEFYDRYGGTLYDWNQLYPRITNAIRQVDPETPIIVGGMSYSGIDWLPYIEPTGDPRTVYAVHLYEPSVYTYQSPGNPYQYPGNYDVNWDGIADQVDAAWLDERLGIIDDFRATHQVPVVVNEFGGTRWNPGLAEYMRGLMSLFEAHDLNYALWEWPSSWEPFISNNNAFNFLFGPDPNNNSYVETSDLIEVIREFWGLNEARP